MTAAQKQKSFLQRQLLFSLAVTGLFVLLGFVASFYLIRTNMETRRNSNEMESGLLRMAIDMANYMPPEEVIRVLSRGPGRGPRPPQAGEMPLPPPGHLGPGPGGPGGPRPELLLLNEQGLPLMSDRGNFIPSDVRVPPELLPAKTSRVAKIDEEIPSDGKPVVRYFVARLNGSPTKFFAVRMHLPGGPGPRFPLPPFTGFVLIAALLATLLSFLIIIRYWKKKSDAILAVISSIREGNLKARFNVDRLDEIGLLMSQFNDMADKIESLVEAVRSSEKMRIQILQEIGHDFRTPLASIKNSLQTIVNRDEAVSSSLRREMLSTSVDEIDYISRLVDDLLFLARVENPKYANQAEHVRIHDVIEEEVVRSKNAVSASKLNLSYDDKLPVDFEITSDAHLMRRLLKNAIDNAVRYANSRVTLTTRIDMNTFVLTVEDDGPGFPEEILNSYGSKRVSRAREEAKDGRISLGLGSVIILAIVHAHHGKLVVENIYTAQGAVLGARLRVELPLSL